ncbi:hypothetical protein WA026_007670 [Henosepilachna vigintioctopunctata]|uniref:BTB domain-containing protein n=1 Tax=Henosepilachna vigintioctopunctata TaxID=420089 RepID=A0AAW1U2X6_9CUCU
MLFTWGLNAGQLGHEAINGNYVIQPKQVKVINTQGSSIKHVASSDGAIAVTTEKGDIYVLHEYQCRKIASRLLEISDLAIIGGKLNTALDKDLKLEPTRELKVLVRTTVGNLLIWQESDPQLCRCIFSIPRTFNIKQAMININEILFVTDFGEAYRAVIKPRKKKTMLVKKTEFNKFLLKEECISLKLTKIPRIHRGVYIVSDPRGEDFCVIQQNPYSKNLFQDKPPESEMKKQLATLLEDAREEDNIHDVRINIGNRVFPVHRYILAHKSYTLQSICQDEEVTLKDTNADFFEQLLMFIYTGWCDLLQVGECPNRFKNYCIKKNCEITSKNEEKKAIQNPIRMLQGVSKRFGCTELYKILSGYDMQGVKIYTKSAITSVFKSPYQIKDFPEYYDVILRCSDNKEISAHKCILSARLEYFNSMFSIRWSNVEKSVISVPYTGDLVEALLEFVYTDSTSYLSKKDSDFLLKLLVIADEYLLNELKDHCSFLLLTLTYLDLKNAVEILQFAHYYKANSLKQGVMKYIVDNMAYFLETQALNDLTDDVLGDLTTAYFEQRRQICCRVITPYSTAVPDDIIADINTHYPVNVEIPEEKKAEKNSSKYPKRRLRTSKNTLENSVTKCFEKRADNLDSLIQFPDSLDNPEDVAQKDNTSITKMRLNAISSAIETLESEDYIPHFQNLNNSFTSLDQFPLLNSPPERNVQEVSSPPSSGRSWNRHEGKHGMSRLSQKERKRLSSESKEAAQIITASPKNPWKILTPEATSPICSPPDGAAFSDILSNERKQKENLFKMANKLLIHTQLEDKAILELEKFYNIDNIEDEIINVQRVEIGKIASPIWVPRNQGHSSHS